MSSEAECGTWRHECNRCGYVWYSKRPNPKVCAARTCQSKYWNKPRKYKTPAGIASKSWDSPREKRPRGRPKAVSENNAKRP